DAALPSTIGSRGSTQGERIERIPAKNANSILPIIIAGFPSPNHLCRCAQTFRRYSTRLLFASRREISPTPFAPVAQSVIYRHGWTRRSDRFPDHRKDRVPFGIADRARLFLFALERNQGRLHADAEAIEQILLAVEVDHEINEFPE